MVGVRWATIQCLLASGLFIPEFAIAQQESLSSYPPDYGRKWAIIVSIDQYYSINNLRTAASGARALKKLLMSDFGYVEADICYLSDEAELRKDKSTILATKHDIENSFSKWLAECHPNPGDSLLVYFAGHGTDDPDAVGIVHDHRRASGEGYLAALETKAGEPDSWIKVSQLVDWINATPVSHRLLILDCCYSGQLFQRPDARGAGSSVDNVLLPAYSTDHQHSAQTDTEIRYYLSRPAFYGMSAGRDFVVSDGGDNRSGAKASVFTAVFLRELRNRANSARPDQVFTFRRDLAPRIERALPDTSVSWQIPDWGRLTPGDGDFLFRPTRRASTSIDRAEAARRISFATDQAAAHEYDVAEALLDPCPTATRAWEWNYLKEMCRLDRLTFSDHLGPVTGVTGDPPGRLGGEENLGKQKTAFLP